MERVSGDSWRGDRDDERDDATEVEEGLDLRSRRGVCSVVIASVMVFVTPVVNVDGFSGTLRRGPEDVRGGDMAWTLFRANRRLKENSERWV
jgi:hypothetical protein